LASEGDITHPGPRMSNRPDLPVPGKTGTARNGPGATGVASATKAGFRLAVASPADRLAGMDGSRSRVPPPWGSGRFRPALIAACLLVSAGLPARASPPAVAADPAHRPLRVVLDPGHGGLSNGAVGVAGIPEKRLTLQLALLVRDLLAQEPGIEVVMTRDQDVDVDLAARPRVGQPADLFVSLHLNAAPSAQPRGIETYFLGPASDPGASQVAERENAEAVDPGPLAEDTDVAEILADLWRVGVQMRSAHLAQEVQQGMARAVPGAVNRGVRQANFAVLRLSPVPAIVVEAGFLTHPQEGRRLADPSYLGRLARGIARGILRYAGATARERQAMTTGRQSP